jgi:uncharacterized membrane protein YphA (DoxX/SURF4 family)
MYKLKRIAVYLKNCYQLDLRAISLMRIFVGLVVLADLLFRLPDLEAHYTDLGIWPSHLVQTFGWKAGYWSIHLLGSDKSFILAFFILHLVCALALTIGFKTRLFTILVWILTISLHNRNIYILQAGDDLLRITLFWAIFLPWGAHYSLDALKRRTVQLPTTAANLGYLILIASVYFFTILLKTGNEWRGEGSAVYFALSLEQLRLPATGDFIYQFPALMQFITWFVLILEIIIPILILFPSRFGTTRLAAFILICVLHIGISISLYVGLFFIIGIVCSVGLLPESAMDFLEARIRSLQVSVYRAVPVRGASKHVVGGFCVVFIIFGLIVNAGTVREFSYELRRELWYPVNALRLDQHWGMFSPNVLKKDGWFVLHGADSLGNAWDLRHNKNSIDYAKPAHIVSHYRTDRWRKLAENLQNDNFTFLRPLYGSYILRTWNREHPEKHLSILNVYFMEKENLPGYKSTEIKKVLYCVSNDH